MFLMSRVLVPSVDLTTPRDSQALGRLDLVSEIFLSYERKRNKMLSQ